MDCLTARPGAADQVRTRLTNATRNPNLVNRLVPRLPGEVPSIYRARLLVDTLTAQMSASQSSAVQAQVRSVFLF